MNSDLSNNKNFQQAENTQIQKLAEFFGWDRNKSILVNQESTEIAPNGTRRARRINNNYIVKEEDYNSKLKDL